MGGGGEGSATGRQVEASVHHQQQSGGGWRGGRSLPASQNHTWAESEEGVNRVESNHGPRRVHEGPRARPAGGRGEDAAEEEDAVERDQEHVPPTAANAQQVGTLPAVSDLPFNTCAAPPLTCNLLKDLRFGFYPASSLQRFVLIQGCNVYNGS